MDWEKVLTAVKEKSPRTMGLLKACKTMDLTEERLSLCFTSDWAASKMHKAEHLEALKDTLLSLYSVEPEIEITSIAPREIPQVDLDPNTMEWGEVISQRDAAYPEVVFSANGKMSFKNKSEESLEKLIDKAVEISRKKFDGITTIAHLVDFWVVGNRLDDAERGETLKSALHAFINKHDGVDYYEYIQSEEWKKKAYAAKKKADMRCQLCYAPGDGKSLHAHHRTYERLGNEKPGDITVLCADCHTKFHDKN